MANRRRFFKDASLLALLPYSSNLLGDEKVANDEVFAILEQAQKLIFPTITRLDIKALGYLKLILSHSKISKKDKDFIINGAIWLNELSLKKYQISFINLDEKSQIKLLNLAINDESWGENWIYDMLVFCTEATLCDPIYGSNTNENGWKWLGHESAYPRPQKPYL